MSDSNKDKKKKKIKSMYVYRKEWSQKYDFIFKRR